MATARAKIVKKLDALWSLAIRAKFAHKCVICGSSVGLAAHHCVVRKAQTMGVRWLEWNGVALCYSCHICKLHSGQADKSWLEMFLRKLDELIPKDKQEEVRKIGHGLTKYSIDDLRELVKTGWWAEACKEDGGVEEKAEIGVKRVGVGELKGTGGEEGKEEAVGGV